MARGGGARAWLVDLAPADVLRLPTGLTLDASSLGPLGFLVGISVSFCSASSCALKERMCDG